MAASELALASAYCAYLSSGLAKAGTQANVSSLGSQHKEAEADREETPSAGLMACFFIGRVSL